MEKNKLLKGLTDEQIKKARNCSSPEELLELAKEEGVELTDEQLLAVSGGGCVQEPNMGPCPECGSSNVGVTTSSEFSIRTYYCECHDCLFRWSEKHEL